MWSLKVTLLFLISVEGLTPSPGCSSTHSSLPAGRVFFHEPVAVTEDNSSKIRIFSEFIPETYDDTVPLPLQVWMHGQYGVGEASALYYKFTDYPMISVYPQGIDDSADQDCGTGWNVGDSSHDSSTCNEEAYSASCCYSSCLANSRCSGDDAAASCGWATCHDDVAFLRVLIDTVANETCVDLDAVFLSGLSNGGMMTHHGYQALPGVFSAVMPVEGSPLLGYNHVPTANALTSILAMHDRSDTVIPPAGGNGGGWFYESVDDVLTEWAALHECDLNSTQVKTNFDGGEHDLACAEWLHCRTDGAEHRVMKCMYDGTHGSWPDQGEALAWWFFNQSTFR